MKQRTLIAATGGTARHSLALEHAVRPLFSYLRAVTVSTAVFAAAEDWGDAADRPLRERIERAGPNWPGNWTAASRLRSPTRWLSPRRSRIFATD